jgi:hypothetical protein
MALCNQCWLKLWDTTFLKELPPDKQDAARKIFKAVRKAITQTRKQTGKLN